MRNEPPHLSDSELLLAADGELREISRQRHLLSCQACQSRQATLSRALEEYKAIHHGIAPHARAQAQSKSSAKFALGASAAAAALLAVAIWTWSPSSVAEPGGPNPRLTPGATLAGATREQVCAVPSSESPAVPAALANEVFRRYGIERPQPRDFEVDYLIPPDLGGAQEAANLWPQPYDRGVWNSRVKDALEDRLRAEVCSGRIDLETAQREFASGWVAAYRRYFRTAAPLFEHASFVKDKPWE